MRIAIVGASRWAAQGVAAALAQDTPAPDGSRDSVEVQVCASIEELMRAGGPAPGAIVCISTDGAAARRLYDGAPAGVPLVMLAEDFDDLLAHLGSEPGALALMSTRTDDARLRAALAAVMQGLSVREAGAARAWNVHALHQRAPDVPFEPLTPRELEVFELLAKGLSNRDIGVALNISPHTAKFHVAQILDKTGAATRAEAVRLGLRLGLVGI